MSGEADGFAGVGEVGGRAIALWRAATPLGAGAASFDGDAGRAAAGPGGAAVFVSTASTWTS